MVFILLLIATCMYSSFSSCMEIKTITPEARKHQKFLEQESKHAVEPQYNPIMRTKSDILIHFVGNPAWYNNSFDMQICCFIRKLSVLNKEMNHTLIQLHPAFFKTPRKIQRKTRPRTWSYEYTTTW